MKKSAPSGRRVQIADAALEILARGGSRRVTHRAIDHKLGLPEGSTSYYYRKHADLFAAAARRLIELDMLDMKWQIKMSSAPAGTVDSDQLADQLSETLLDWLSPAKRERSVAKCELFLEAWRNEAIRGIVSEIQEQFSVHTKNVLRALGAKNPTKAAESLLHVMLGAVYARAISPSYRVDRTEMKQLVRNAVALAKER